MRCQSDRIDRQQKQSSHLRPDLLPDQSPDHCREALPRRGAALHPSPGQGPADLRQEHEALPSIRSLAKDLRISVITTKRAYDELEKEGFIYPIAAKGCFVAPKNVELLREETLKNIENHIDQIVRLSQSVGLSEQEVLDMVKFAMED